MSVAKRKKDAFVFIDGNNVYHNLKLMAIKPSHIDFQKMSNLVCSHFNFNYVKSFYYNSIPSLADGKGIYYAHMKFLGGIRALPNFVVKTRKLQRSSTLEILAEKKALINDLGLCHKCKPLVESNCADCIGNTKKREKGIDVMMAVDMLDLSVIQNKCDVCILISGDADFVPVARIIKDNGKEIYSAFLTKGYSYELRDKLDFFILNRDLLIKKCLK